MHISQCGTHHYLAIFLCLLVLSSYPAICCGSPGEDGAQWFDLKTAGKQYPLKDFPPFKIMRNGPKVFLINDSGRRALLGVLGAEDLDGAYQPGFKDVMACDGDHNGQPVFFIKTSEGKIGSTYTVVDSSGVDISKRIFQGDAPIMQNPIFSYVKNEISFVYMHVSAFPPIDCISTFTYEKNAYVNTSTMLQGECFSKNIDNTKERQIGQGGFVSKQGKTVTLNGILSANAYVSQDSSLNLSDESKTLTSGSPVKIIDMAVINWSVAVLVRSNDNRITGWIPAGDLGSISCASN